MRCKLCKWLCGRFCGDDIMLRYEAFRNGSTAWERDQSNDDALWCASSDEGRALADQAQALRDTDPEAAFRLHLAAADAGVVWAMEQLGWHYETGTVVAADLGQAAACYHRAICAGSWMATIAYARVLAAQGHFGDAEAVLEDGVRSDFVPASFWLAWLRQSRSPRRETYRQIRPLLDHAASHGHPKATLMRARWMMAGKFGIGEMLGGLRLMMDIVVQLGVKADPADGADADARPDGGRPIAEDVRQVA